MLFTLFIIMVVIIENQSISILKNDSDESCRTSSYHIYHKNYSKYNFNYYDNSIQRIDPTWSQYIDLVYGDNTSSQLHLYPSLQKTSNNFEFFYLNTNIKISSLSIIQQVKEPLILSSTRFMTRPNQIHPRFHNYQWVEVMRYKVKSIYKNFPNEGLFAPQWPQFNYFNSTKAPYGCWFFLAPGSGIYINVGKVLVITGKKKEIYKYFTGYLNLNGCIYDDKSKFCKDKYFCLAAMAKGAIL